MEIQRALNKRNPRKTTQRHTVIKMTKIEDKERILEAARVRQTVAYKGNLQVNLQDYQQISQKKLYRTEGSVMKYLVH